MAWCIEGRERVGERIVCAEGCGLYGGREMVGGREEGGSVYRKGVWVEFRKMDVMRKGCEG